MQVITFYSYKGGVGRTLALANIAQRLANDFGKSVAVMDFDLEAPGLHYKFQPEFDKKLKIKQGLVDYIHNYSVKGNLPESILPYTKTLPKYTNNAKPIHLIAAGDTNSNIYWQKLAEIDWHELFYKPHSQGVNFILNLKSQIENELKPEFLLIDSRTGITEISGITISLLADDCVILSVNNEESIAGSGQVINSIRKAENKLFKTPNIYFVLSRIPYSLKPEIRGQEIKLVENLKKKLNLPQIHVLHSDPELEWQENIRIGDIHQNDEVPIGQEYLELFEAIIHPHLTDKDFEQFEKIKQIKKLLIAVYGTFDNNEKIDLYTKILEIDRNNVEALEGRAFINYRLKKYDKALNDFEKIGSKFFKERVECLRGLKKYSEALILLNRLFKTSIKDESLYELKYKLLDDSGASDDEINKFFEEWEHNSAKTSEFYNTRANWFLENNLHQKALEDAQKAVNIDVKYAMAYTTLAESQAALGNDEGFFINIELAFVFGLKKDITPNLNIPRQIYSKYINNLRFRNLLKQYNVEAEFMTLMDEEK